MLDVLVQLLVAACGLRSIDVASSDEMSIWRREVKRIRNNVNIAEW